MVKGREGPQVKRAINKGGKRIRQEGGESKLRKEKREKRKKMKTLT